MFFDVGMSPFMSLLIATLMFAIICDFLLEIFSVRWSLSTGRFQVWIFDRFGQSPLAEFLYFLSFQFFSLKKRCFFPQVASLVNVGSFSKKQTLLLVFGSFCGWGLSIPLMLLGPWTLGIGFCLFCFCLSFLSKDQIRDFGFALFSLGLFLIAVTLFDAYLQSTAYSIFQYKLGPFFGFGLLLISTLFFRTSIAFLIFLSLFHFYVGMNIVWFPILFVAHNVLASFGFVWQIFSGGKRLSFLLISVAFAVTLQFFISFLIVLYWSDGLLGLETLVDSGSFVGTFRFCVIAYGLFCFVPTLLATPVVAALGAFGLWGEGENRKAGSQKILNANNRGDCFSIHLSLLLLRQEFKKYVTSVHTIFKIGREADEDKDEVNRRFSRYQSMLSRVGDEIKELCFNIGRQRSYRWQVKEVMSYYRYINQLELLVEDLSVVADVLQEEGLAEDWEKDCRYWLGLQLKIFESFFDFTVGVPRDSDSRSQVDANIKRSFDVLGRLNQSQSAKASSQTLYRITESIAHLAR